MFADLYLQSFGWQAILNKYFHSSCYLSTHDIEPDSHTVAFNSCCRHTDTCTWANTISISCQIMFAHLRVQVFTVKPLSKDAFIRLLFWAHGGFKHEGVGAPTNAGVSAPTQACREEPLGWPMCLGWPVCASFGSQAILKEYFHSSCFCAPCFLEPDNQQWHSIRCFCMHA